MQSGHLSGPAVRTRHGCLWLLLAGAGFIVLLYGLFIFFLTRPLTGADRAHELEALQRCQVQAEQGGRSMPGQQFTRDSCQEMARQFRIKFGSLPAEGH